MACRQSLQNLRASIKEPCEIVGSSLAWALRELGESIKKMNKCETAGLIMPKLKSIRHELNLIITPSALASVEKSTDALELASFVFSLMEMVDKVEELTKEVEELGGLAGFHVNSK